jgi:quercetin dioxygenase-like cupin family protein
MRCLGKTAPMNPEAAVVDQQAREWEAWPADQVHERGQAEWKTLISAGLTRSEGLTLGVGRLPPGGALHAHRHEQHEAYLVLDGTGVVTIDATAQPVGPGVAVFIPGNAVHSVETTGESDLRMAYVLAADSFEDVEYVFTG